MRQTGTYPNIGRSATKNWTKRNQEDIAFCNATTQYTQDMNAHQQAAGDLYDARQRRNNTSGPARWMANREVGKAEAVLDQLPVPVKPLSPSESMKQRLVATGNWAPMGAIPNADPFQQVGHYQAPINYGDAILVPLGTPMPSNHDIQQALVSSRIQLNPAQLLPVCPATGPP